MKNKRRRRSMNGYYNTPPWWGYPPMYPGFPPMNTPPSDGMTLKKMIREWRAWEKFNKQRMEEEKKKKDEKKPQGPQLKAWEVFIIMTALSPVIGPVLSRLKDMLLAHLQ
jgi:hypothetical protein